MQYASFKTTQETTASGPLMQRDLFARYVRSPTASCCEIGPTLEENGSLQPSELGCGDIKMGGTAWVPPSNCRPLA